MATAYAYPVELTQDDNGTVLVTSPDIPEMVTVGETEADALLQAVDALTAMLDEYIEDGRPIPKPTIRPGMPSVPLPLRVAMKLALHDAMVASGTTQKALAARLNMDAKQVRRMLDLTQKGLRPDEFDRAFRTLGRRPVMVLEAA